MVVVPPQSISCVFRLFPPQVIVHTEELETITVLPSANQMAQRNERKTVKRPITEQFYVTSAHMIIRAHTHHPQRAHTHNWEPLNYEALNTPYGRMSNCWTVNAM